MNDNKKQIWHLEEPFIKAQQGDKHAIDYIIKYFTTFCEQIALTYSKNIYPDDVEDLVQEGRLEVDEVIRVFNYKKHSLNDSYFYVRISRRINWYYKKHFARKFETLDKQSGDAADDKLLKEIIEKAQGPIFTKEERYVFMNSNKVLGARNLLQKEIAAELNVSQPTVSRINSKALEKILIALGKQVDKTRIRQILNKKPIELSTEGQLKYLEETFQLLHDMLPFHMPLLKIGKKLSDGSYNATVWQGIPTDILSSKRTAIVDTLTPDRELDALIQYIFKFQDPNQNFNDTIIINKIPARNMLKDFIRVYAPYTTKKKMDEF